MNTLSTVLQQYVKKLLKHQDLTAEESVMCCNELLESANQIQVAGFLALLTAKGETVDELVASNLNPKVVNSAVCNKARGWYITRVAHKEVNG